MLIFSHKRPTIVLILCLLISLLSGLNHAIGAHTAAGTSDNAAKEKNNMVWIPPGTFSMGCEEASFIDAKPIHKVHIDGFWLDKTLVTNQQFAEFVRATNYITIAERKPQAKDFPGAPPENLVPGALVFTAPSHPVSLHSHYQWWRYVPGASWQHPEGPASNIKKRRHHPVVQVAYDDAIAYAHWAGKRLPTEAEFEYAARGSLDRKQFSWGNNLKPNGKWQANIWQGEFPSQNTMQDGFYSTAPVASFPANGYGLYDMTGNVWEWCSDWYRADYYKGFTSGTIADNPHGPDNSFDPYEPGVPKRVQRGGSFLCSDQYCARYLVGARGKGEPSSGCSNVGFRCAK